MDSRDYAVAIVLKTDNGNKGIITNKSERNLWNVNQEIFNRKLHPYKKGTLLNVTIRFSSTGRMMVQNVSISKDSKIKEEKHPSPIVEATTSRKGISARTFVAKVTEGKALLEPDMERADDIVPEAARGYVKRARRGLEDVVVSGSVVMEPLKEAYPDKAVSRRSTISESDLEVIGDLAGAKTNATPRKEKVAKDSDLLAGYYVSHDARVVFNAVFAMSNKTPDTAVKVMMVGPSGMGKTTLPKIVAELTGKRFMRMNCATVRDPEEWFGYREARDGNTVFVHSEFAKAILEGNLVVVLDEFNRLEPWLHNTLFPLLDDDGATVVHGEEFRIGPGVIVVGTINTGYRYTGTFELDEALLNRFEFVLEVGAMPQADERRILMQRTGISEESAQNIVKMASVLRDKDINCSTRTTLRIAMKVAVGMTEREAFEFAVIRRIPVDSSGSGLRKVVMDLVNSHIGVLETRKLTVDIFKGSSVEEVSEAAVAAPESSLRATSLKLERDSSRAWLRIQIIQLLRSLPCRSFDGVGFSLSLREAQQIVEKLEKGETYIFELNSAPDDLGTTIANLGLNGVSVEIRKA